jgi:hypothetical protein
MGVSPVYLSLKNHLPRGKFNEIEPDKSILEGIIAEY